MPLRRSSTAGPATVGLALAVSILFFAYPTFAAFFLADDFLWLLFAQSQPGWLWAALAPSPGGWTTPVSNLLFAAEFSLFGGWAAGYYLVGALLHLVNALLLYDLVRQVAGRRGLAFGAALIFAVHFVHYSDFGALVWISAFVQVVVTAFYLAAFCLYARYARTGQQRYWWGALLAFVLALLSKEAALSLPVMLTAWWGLARAGQGRFVFRQAIRELGPFYGIWLIYLVYETGFQSSGFYLQQDQFKIGWHLLTNLSFLSNLFVPNPASPPVSSFLTRSFPAWAPVAADGLAWSLRLLLLAVALGLWLKGPARLRLWLAWTVICHLPFLGFVEGLAGPNRYFYLSSAGLAVLLAEGAAWVYARLAERFWGPAAQWIAALLLLGGLGYNLAPARVWQRQMLANSEVRREVLRLVEAASTPARPSAVYLLGFPEKYFDLPPAIWALQGIPEVTLVTAGESLPPAPAAADALAIVYEAGQLSVLRP